LNMEMCPQRMKKEIKEVCGTEGDLK